MTLRRAHPALHRRAFVAGAGLSLAAATVWRPREAWATDADVVVIGAGAAGVAAARALRAAGRQVVVVEGRDRVGGRVHTSRALGASYDAGARYLHWQDRNPLVRVARTLGVRTVLDDDVPAGGTFGVYAGPDGAVGTVASSGAGASSGPVDRNARRAAYWRVASLLDADEGSVADVSILDRVAAASGASGVPAPADLQAARTLSQLVMGEEPDRVSARDYADLWAGDDREVPDGVGTLVERAAAGLPIRLSVQAHLVRWGGAGVEVETSAGTIRAAAVIVTVPVGVLKAGGLRFSPDLPATHVDALDGLRMGALTKIALRIEGTRLGVMQDSSSIFDVSGDGGPFNTEFWPDGKPLVVLTFGGDQARAVVAEGEAGAVAFAVERVSAMTGTAARPFVTGGHLAGWCAELHSLGSYSVVVPGRVGAREALGRALGERVHFAGEATAGGGSVTVGGAWMSGEAAARAAAATLARSRAPSRRDR